MEETITLKQLKDIVTCASAGIVMAKLKKDLEPAIHCAAITLAAKGVPVEFIKVGLTMIRNYDAEVASFKKHLEDEE